MERGVKISFVILFLVLFIGIVSAYNSFSLIKEDRDSKKAVIIYNINPYDAIKNYNTVIQLNYIEGDFLDLALYIKNSKITRIVYYQQDILSEELLNILRNEAGINLVQIASSTPINRINNLNSDSGEILITGKVTEGQEEGVYLIFIVFSIVIVVVLAVLLIFMPKKKKRN